ncbi:hypothetical protein IJT93_10440 [bacterium]|nr:hypothetical protein [bacterium]
MISEKFWQMYGGAEWDYILDGPLSGKANMERDLELLAGCGKPTLRLYSWLRPTLSLGRNQKDGWVDYRLCESLNVEVTRRPTGGRALLHMPDEITYAVILPDFGALSVSEAFASLASMLALCLKMLGLPVGVAESGHIPGGASHPSCLAVTAPGEVTAYGRKLVGSAQVRREGRLLQHGSLVRRYNEELLQKVIPGAQAEMDLNTLGFADLQAEDIAAEWRQAAVGAPELWLKYM